MTCTALLPVLTAAAVPSHDSWQSSQDLQQSDLFWGFTWSNLKALFRSGSPNISSARVCSMPEYRITEPSNWLERCAFACT